MTGKAYTYEPVVHPTAANFFESISKSQIQRALNEAGKTPGNTTTFEKRNCPIR
jgi:hypothetical protein